MLTSERINTPRKAMVLAAGLGRRMLPLTLTQPKAMIRVGGKPLIDYAICALEREGVSLAVVNVHHFAGQVEAHLAAVTRPKIVISDERLLLLDSGGGIAAALHHFAGEPFFILNSDTFWIDRGRPNLARMAACWDPARADILLLLCATGNAIGYQGKGDFAMDAEGRLRRRGEYETVPYVYAGAALIRPQIFVDLPGPVFSLNLLFDRAISQGRMYGMPLDGLWLHVGTPESIRAAEDAVAAWGSVAARAGK